MIVVAWEELHCVTSVPEVRWCGEVWGGEVWDGVVRCGEVWGGVVQ